MSPNVACMAATSIVVGIDGPEHSLEALRLGLFLGRASDARLLVASVSRVDPYSPGPPGAEAAVRR